MIHCEFNCGKVIIFLFRPNSFSRKYVIICEKTHAHSHLFSRLIWIAFSRYYAKFEWIYEQLQSMNSNLTFIKPNICFVSASRCKVFGRALLPCSSKKVRNSWYVLIVIAYFHEKSVTTLLFRRVSVVELNPTSAQSALLKIRHRVAVNSSCLLWFLNIMSLIR